MGMASPLRNALDRHKGDPLLVERLTAGCARSLARFLWPRTHPARQTGSEWMTVRLNSPQQGQVALRRLEILTLARQAWVGRRFREPQLPEPLSNCSLRFVHPLEQQVGLLFEKRHLIKFMPVLVFNNLGHRNSFHRGVVTGVTRFGATRPSNFRWNRGSQRAARADLSRKRFREAEGVSSGERRQD